MGLGDRAVDLDFESLFAISAHGSECRFPGLISHPVANMIEALPRSVTGDPIEPTCDLSVVIPLFNEIDSVEPLLRSLAAALASPPATGWRCEVILVDDGSTDGTAGRAAEIAGRLAIATRVLVLGRNFGQTAAMQAGIEAASGRLIATLDGDLQNDPADIPRLVSRLESEGLDLVVGRRRRRQDGLWLRLIPSWVANRLIGWVTGVRIHDYGCSLKVYRGVVVRQVRLMGEMHRFIPAWVALVTHPSRIGEADVRHHARRHGTSKYGISRTFRVVLDLIAVLFFMKYRMRPGHFFGSLGLLVGAVGTLMLATVLGAKWIGGQDIGTRPMLLLGGFAMLSSLQLVCFGVMAEMLSRVHYDVDSRRTYSLRAVWENASARGFTGAGGRLADAGDSPGVGGSPVPGGFAEASRESASRFATRMAG